jgi:hypothetical protein
MIRAGKLITLVALLLAMGACSRSNTITGVENEWREAAFAPVAGVTTEADVLESLGPPSQIINLQDQTVYYYIRESFQSDRLLLIIYNQTERRTAYDRAVFFFNSDGVLTKFSFSETALPRE